MNTVLEKRLHQLISQTGSDTLNAGATQNTDHPRQKAHLETDVGLCLWALDSARKNTHMSRLCLQPCVPAHLEKWGQTSTTSHQAVSLRHTCETHRQSLHLEGPCHMTQTHQVKSNKTFWHLSGKGHGITQQPSPFEKIGTNKHLKRGLYTYAVL